MTEFMLICAGIIAGAINALAGGGSFILFPALLWAGVPPVMANASNTYASLPGYVSGAFGYRKDLMRLKGKLLIYSSIALVGGWLGAELLLRVSDALFSQLVPWLMAVAVLLFAFGAQVNAFFSALGKPSKRGAIVGGALLLLVLFLVCLYGGFFNAGLGILLLAFLALAGVNDLHAMNGMKLWMSALVAIVAVVRLALSGSIAWYEGSLAFVGTLIGGYLAARLAHHIPTSFIRGGIIIFGLVLTVLFFKQAYF